MFRRVALPLAFLSALTGCVSAPPNGPLVEYHAGVAPVTRTASCEADYALVAKDRPDATTPVVVHHLAKGECVGFRREADGSVVAVAPGYTMPLPPGAYSWEVVRDSVPPWRERLWCETKQHAAVTGRVSGILAGVGCFCVIGLALVLVYCVAAAYDQKQKNQGQPQRAGSLGVF